MFTVRGLLQEKTNKELFSIGPRARVSTANNLMRRKKIGSLLVIEKNKLVGIMTIRDSFLKINHDVQAAKDTLVREVMTPKEEVISVTSFANMNDCLAVMDHHTIQHLLVIEDGEEEVIGIVSIRDVARSICAHQDYLAGEMGNYNLSRT